MNLNEYGLRQISVVIMDASDKNTTMYIARMVKEWSPVSAGEPLVYNLSKNHPSTIVVKTEMYDKDFIQMKDRIKRRFPGLCMFNPALAV